MGPNEARTRECGPRASVWDPWGEDPSKHGPGDGAGRMQPREIVQMKRVIVLLAVLTAPLTLLSAGGSAPAGAQSGARIHLIHGIQWLCPVLGTSTYCVDPERAAADLRAVSP